MRTANLCLLIALLPACGRIFYDPLLGEGVDAGSGMDATLEPRDGSTDVANDRNAVDAPAADTPATDTRADTPGIDSLGIDSGPLGPGCAPSESDGCPDVSIALGSGSSVDQVVSSQTAGDNTRGTCGSVGARETTFLITSGELINVDVELSEATYSVVASFRAMGCDGPNMGCVSSPGSAPISVGPGSPVLVILESREDACGTVRVQFRSSPAT